MMAQRMTTATSKARNFATSRVVMSCEKRIRTLVRNPS
jgi:hypothetical protein